jgi:DNA-binding MarR family transcriptional regulator
MGFDYADTVGYEFIRAAKAYRNRAREELSELGLHVGQEMLLLQLWEEDGLSHSELADRLNVELPAISKMVNRMESAGWIECRSDPADSRVSRVFLTNEGRALQEPVENIWRQTEMQMLDGLSTEEKLLFRRILVDVRDNLSELE